ncbi:MAG TPA: OsmC family protein [Acidobacteriota bacterium]|nr:OsmC family protein [Acidobacteriota bacterium]
MNPKELKVVFGENYKIDVEYKGFTVKTDQPLPDGGDNTAPSPFDYFLVSLASCAGYYALAFCKERKIPTEGLAVSMAFERPAGTRLVQKISIEVTPPAGFPEKYRTALVKSVDHCTVKAHLDQPPKFETILKV